MIAVCYVALCVCHLYTHIFVSLVTVVKATNLPNLSSHGMIVNCVILQSTYMYLYVSVYGTECTWLFALAQVMCILTFVVVCMVTPLCSISLVYYTGPCSPFVSLLLMPQRRFHIGAVKTEHKTKDSNPEYYKEFNM